ncbi:MAG: M50 family metallopeptidase [Defluviitaleaceae bacterium]|nr:M50 family metallopeptidase [Defluviitaleaceae bacterium]
MDTFIGILIFILILGVVIFIHELGHFLAARHAGIFVEEFALGMGPKLFGFHGKKKSLDGETTLFSLRALPIGGFCRMRGMDDESPDDPEAMNSKSIPARSLVMAGGSIMNFLLAFVLFFALVMMNGYPSNDIASVEAGFPAYDAGVRARDVITHINGTCVSVSDSLATVLQETGGADVTLRVDRRGTYHDFTITPLRIEVEGGHIYRLGIGHRAFGLLSLGGNFEGDFRLITPWEGTIGAGREIIFHISAPFQLLSQLIAGDPMPEGGALMGPIGIAAIVVEVYQETIEYSIIDTILTMIFLAALLNTALGVMNLLPIPALDGAKLVFLAIEAVRRKPIPPEKEAYVHIAGMILLLALAIFIAYQDIARLINPGAYPG